MQSVSSFICHFHRFQNRACVFCIPVISLFCADVKCCMYLIPDLCYYGCPSLFYIDRNFSPVIPFWDSIPIHVRLFQSGCH